METSDILEAAVEAGRIILENGGETYRVEETMSRICNAFDMEDANCVVTTTSIYTSAKDLSGKTYAIVRRIRARAINLDKISKVNDLSRNIQSGNKDIASFRISLTQIDHSTMYPDIVYIVASALAAGFFTLLFGGNWRDFCVACVIGCLIKTASLWQRSIEINDFFNNVTGGAIASLIALLAVHFKIASNLNYVIIGSIMLLVPGVQIMNAIRDTISGDLLAGISRAVEALLIAVAIAVGSGLILLIWVKYMGGLV